MRKNRKQTAAGTRGVIRAVAALLFMLLPFLITSCSDSGSTTTTPTDPRPPVTTHIQSFLKTYYRASHNSYSGNLDDGYRGSIIQQLDAGLRVVELDIRWKFSEEKAERKVVFEVGHENPGDQVDYSNGNPDDDDCEKWISTVKNWVVNNQPTEPVILAFDWKSDFNKDKTEDTNALDALHGYFSDKSIYLFPDGFDPLESPTTHPGRIMVVLSGNEDARKYYGGYSGSTPYCFSDCQDSSPPEAHMFVEYQDGNDDVLKGEFFYARKFESGGCTWAKNIEESDHPHFTRLWLLTSPCEFDKDDWKNPDNPPKIPHVPATNFPYFGWYARYTGPPDPDHPERLKAIPDFGFEAIDWRTYETPRKGSNPDVAVNNLGHVVEVHKSQNSDHLYYGIGNISEDGHSIKWDTENQNYTDDRIHGTTPTVAIVDHLNADEKLLLVEIHVDGGDNLYYRFGLINTKDGTGEWEGKKILTGKIDWLGENWSQYDTGEHPSVAINEDKMVVEVHEGGDNKLWYNVGGFDGDEFRWKEPFTDDRNYNTGVRPTVALLGNRIFEAHNSSNDYLWCQIGLLNASSKIIDWVWKYPDPYKEDEQDYTTYPFPIDESGSLYPSVALYSKGAVEAHMSSGGGIWWRMGKTSNSVMAVGPTKDIQDTYSDVSASGTKISIATSDTHVVLAYISGDSNIYYMVGDLK